MPPSTRGRLDQLLHATNDDAWQARMPFIHASDTIEQYAQIWKHALSATAQDGCAPCATVPISTAFHEDNQLYYARDGIPLCSLGDRCAALQYPGNQGPLPIYVPASVEAKIASGQKHTYDPDATCLLCIRRDVHGACLAFNAMVPNSSAQLMKSSVMSPPFCNLCNVPNGYKQSAMATNSFSVFNNCNLVGVSGEIRLQYDASRKAFHFDQTRIKINPSSFLFPGTTPHTN